jgi:SSS family solute:Na+ symporter
MVAGRDSMTQPDAAMTLPLGPVDLAVLVAFLGTAVVVGLLAGGRARTIDAYLLGDRNLPWWVILGSIVATETSTATVLSVPGEGFGPVGMRFLQLPLGFMIGRLAIVRFLLPLYFEGRLNTAHEVLGRRFGPAMQRAASLLFLVSRNLADGLRLFLAAIVVQRLTGLAFPAAVGLMGAVTILYTVLGGIRSVAWNDCIQLVVYMIGGVAALFLITARIPGGWPAAWTYAASAGRLQLFDFSLDPANPCTFWAGLLGGAVLSLGTHGTDHMMVQRYLSARGQRDAARAVAASGVVVFLQFALFLAIGVLLAAYHGLSGEPPPDRADEVFASFVVNHFPRNCGLVGLLLAAILAAAMSTLSSSLNASASALVHDVVIPLAPATGRAGRMVADPAALLTLTRGLTILFGVLQIGVGIGAAALDETVIRSALAIAGCAAGLLLGVFALGVGTRRVGQAAAMAGAVAGLAALLAVQFVLPTVGWAIAFPWYAIIGASVTIVVGLAASWMESQRQGPGGRSS